MAHRIDFEGTPWSEALPGARSKSWTGNGTRLRILELRPVFIEAEWCRKGHIVHVVSGDLEVDFVGNLERFTTGDVFVIAPDDRHKARALTPLVRLLLIEEGDSLT